MGLLQVLSSNGSILFGASLLGAVLYIFVKLILAFMDYLSWAPVYNVMPGNPSKHWFWGHLYQYPGPNEEGLKFQMERCKKFPVFHRLWVSFRPLLILHHPDSVKVILKTSDPKPRTMGTVYTLGIDWLGEGLLIANGQKWARNRRLLTPAFHFDILQPYTSINNKSADILASKIADIASQGQSFEIFSLVGLASLDIILQCAFSYESDCQIIGESHPYVKAVHELSELWVKRSLQPLHYFDFIYYMTESGRKFKKSCDFVHKVAEDVIEKRRKTLENGGVSTSDRKSRYLDFLDILLTAKNYDGVGLTPLEIRNEVDTFLFEGHDTTTSSMCWTLYSLACHPDIQQRCQDEIDHLLIDRESDDIKWTDLPKLEYLTQCIKEGMRLHAPVMFVQRVTSQEVTIDGYKVPEGTTVGVNIYNLHHNETVWENPYDFQPDRFTPENSASRDSYAFTPFSAGPRNCIGQHFAMNEQKIILAKLLRRFKLEVDPGHEVKKQLSVVMRAENGIKLKAFPRLV